jgi:hypothetical protein
MRTTCVIGFLMLLSACATTAPVASIACTQPRPLVCTMEFLPTCAVIENGDRKEFSSPCTACAATNVTGYVAGPCSE